MKNILIAVLLLSLLLTGCRRTEPSQTFTGLIYSLTESSILVVEGIESANIPQEEWFNQGKDAISFTVSERTVIIGTDGAQATFAALAAGQTVTVTFSGPLLTSYPAQGEADRVEIISEP